MRLTNGQFVEKMLSSGTNSNELVFLLELSALLLKKYGKAILTENYLKEIAKANPEIVSVMKALKMADKKSVSNIKTIIRLVKEQAEDYKPEFVVQSDADHYSKLKSFLDAEFDGGLVEQNSVEAEEVRVSGEGRYYKRSVEQDVKKLLGVN